MSFLEKNLQFLKNTDQDLAKRVSDHLQHQPIKPLTFDSNGLKNVRFDKNEWLYNNNLENECHVLLEKIHKTYNPQIELWLGLGLGYHLCSYLGNPHPLNQFVLIVEPSMDFFCYFLTQQDLSAFPRKPLIFWLIALNNQELHLFFLRLLNDGNFRNCIQNRLTIEWGYASQRLEETKQIWQDLAVHSEPCIQSNSIDGFYGFMNLIGNWNILQSSPPLSEFKGALEGMPGIVVSSGPSLQHSLHLLKDVRDNAAIFAVDSAYRLLLQAGIQPHMTGCLERIPYQSTLYANTENHESVFFGPPLLYPEIFLQHHGPKVFLEQQGFSTFWLFPNTPPSGQIPPVTCVSHIALYVLWYLGCRPIYLLGQDLAFDPKTRQSHMSGLTLDTSSNTMKSYGMNLLSVPANSGKTIETSELWWHYSIDFLNMIYPLHMDCINVIPSEYGLQLGNIPREDPTTVFPMRFPAKLDVKTRLREIFDEWRQIKQAQHQDAMSASVKEAKIKLPKMLSKLNRLTENIYIFYLEHNLADHPTVDWSKDYQGFLQDIEKSIQDIMDDHSFITLLFPIVAGTHNRLMGLSYTLMAEDNSSSQIWSSKLLIVLNWLSEMIILCQMLLNHLDKIP